MCLYNSSVPLAVSGVLGSLKQIRGQTLALIFHEIAAVHLQIKNRFSPRSAVPKDGYGHNFSPIKR